MSSFQCQFSLGFMFEVLVCFVKFVSLMSWFFPANKAAPYVDLPSVSPGLGSSFLPATQHTL